MQMQMLRLIRKKCSRFSEDIIEAFFGLFTGAYRDGELDADEPINGELR